MMRLHRAGSNEDARTSGEATESKSHASPRPGAGRAEHLYGIELPMLFLHGTRDRFARLDRLQPVCERLGERTTLRLVEGGDHSFGVLKRPGRTQDEVMAELAAEISDWARQINGRFGT